MRSTCVSMAFLLWAVSGSTRFFSIYFLIIIKSAFLISSLVDPCCLGAAVDSSKNKYIIRFVYQFFLRLV
jgi:hypothetical protein